MRFLFTFLFLSATSLASIQSEMNANGEALHSIVYGASEQVSLSDLPPPAKAKAHPTTKDVLTVAKRVFDGTQTSRINLFESRDSGKVSADTFRQLTGEGVAEKNGRVIFKLRNSFTSKTYTTDSAGKRLTARPRTSREYLNIYEAWEDLDSGEWVGYMRTEDDSAKDQSTRGVTSGKLYITDEECLVWDSTGVHPTYYQGADKKRKPGLGLTRTQWCLYSKELVRRTDSATWEVDPKTHKSKGVELNRFKNLVSTSSLALNPPSASEWEVLTDGTERKGPTEASVDSIADGIRFKGKLGLIEGSDKSTVGFAIARIPFIAGAKTNEFFLTGKQDPDDLILSAIIRTKNRAVKGVAGVLSYNAPIAFGPDVEQVKVQFSDFHPYVRGKKLAAADAPALRAEDIEDFGLLIRRSDQDPALRAKDPLEFAIELVAKKE